MARIDIVRTDAEQPFHARFVASNGQTVVWSENYADRRDALSAIAGVAEGFGITMSRPPEENTDPEVAELGLYGETPEGVIHVYPIRDVDERTVEETVEEEQP